MTLKEKVNLASLFIYLFKNDNIVIYLSQTAATTAAKEEEKMRVATEEKARIRAATEEAEAKIRAAAEEADGRLRAATEEETRLRAATEEMEARLKAAAEEETRIRAAAEEAEERLRAATEALTASTTPTSTPLLTSLHAVERPNPINDTVAIGKLENNLSSVWARLRQQCAPDIEDLCKTRPNYQIPADKLDYQYGLNQVHINHSDFAQSGFLFTKVVIEALRKQQYGEYLTRTNTVIKTKAEFDKAFDSVYLKEDTQIHLHPDFCPRMRGRKQQR